MKKPKRSLAPFLGKKAPWPASSCRMNRRPRTKAAAKSRRRGRARETERGLVGQVKEKEKGKKGVRHLAQAS